MSVRIVRLGSNRLPGEGLRIGTVRRPPRGVPKDRFAEGNWFDVWFPLLAPSAATIGLAHASDSPSTWSRFTKKYRAEMRAREPKQALALLAALSHGADFSVGCYCEDEARCHRSILRALLAEHGAKLA